MKLSSRQLIYSSCRAWLRWVLMLALAIMPVEIVLADNAGGCHHEAEAMAMADMPSHDMSTMGPMAMNSDHGCCHEDCHCSTCSGANCSVAHLISLMAFSRQYSDLDVTHSLSVDLYTSLHTDPFVRSLYRPPRS